MINDMFVIDGVAHAYNFSPSNRREGCDFEHHRSLAVHSYEIAHAKLESKDPGYLLTLKEFSARWSPEDLAHTFFVESDIDMMVHHSVQIGSFFPEGTPGWPVGLALKKVAPERVLLYGCVDPFEQDRPKIFAHMERMAAEGAVGFKFYPTNGYFDKKANRLISMLYSDPDMAYPFFEKALQLGIKHVAFHKTMPVGQGPTKAAHVEDLSTAAAVFSDMTFEVVHSGWAFLEECAIQLKLHKNVYANLECTANLAVRQPRRFAHVLGTLLQYANPEQLLFASGCAISHVDPVLNAIASFEMPEDLIEGHDYPLFTPELKRKILGENMAKLHNINIEEKKKLLKNDEWSQRRAQGKAEPWGAHRRRVNAPSFQYPGYVS
jgi:predicted TIM-barrel fold metal-dependent hydrolase